MKRFFCTICQRHKRVRKLPPGVYALGRNDKDKPTSYSDGICVSHNSTSTRAQQQSRVRVVAGIGSTRKTGASAARSKSKKG